MEYGKKTGVFALDTRQKDGDLGQKHAFCHHKERNHNRYFVVILSL